MKLSKRQREMLEYLAGGGKVRWCSHPGGDVSVYASGGVNYNLNTVFSLEQRDLVERWGKSAWSTDEVRITEAGRAVLDQTELREEKA